MFDCINTFNICTFENIYKIEDDTHFYYYCKINFQTSRYDIKGGNVNVIVLGQVFGRTNSFRCKFENMFRTHFEEK